MKYIVLRTYIGDDIAREDIIQFPTMLNHRTVAKHIQSMLQHEYDTPNVKIVSAGFVSNDRCHGMSESLNLESRPKEDTLLLRETTGADIVYWKDE